MTGRAEEPGSSSSALSSKMADEEAQEDELLALASIYDERTFIHSQEEQGGQFNVFLDLPQPFYVKIHAAQVPKSRRKDKPLSLTTPGGAGELENTSAECAKEGGFDTLEVRYLPPVVLNFMLPADYPSTRPPDYTVSCKWLTGSQLSKLCKNLDEIWEDQCPGDVILFRWIQFLMDETLSMLNIKSPVTLSLERNQSHSSDAVDKRAIQDVGSYSMLVGTIFEYEQHERDRVFGSSYYTCNVCFCEKPGTSCMAFYGCNHVYCCECMSGYFTVQIKDGAVKALTCPSDKCDSQALPSQVKQVVSPELFAKYDKFLLQSSLDGMSDISYCPRPDCRSAVMLESESTMGLCPMCSFPFCVFCKRAYHGVSPCSIKNTEFRKLRNEYFQSSPEERAFMEKKYGKQRLKHVFEEVVSEEWVKSNSKKCPSCSSHIQKIDGCNKMTCIKCRCHFCWLCGVVLLRGNPYLHFNTLGAGCFGKLFEGIDSQDDDDDWFGDQDQNNWFL